jgi:putative transposase
MLGAVERRFGNSLPTSPVEWLTDNGSAYRSYQTRQFARMVGLEPKHTAVRSPESNGEQVTSCFWLNSSVSHASKRLHMPLRSTLFGLSGDFGEVVKCKGNVHIL